VIQLPPLFGGKERQFFVLSQNRHCRGKSTLQLEGDDSIKNPFILPFCQAMIGMGSKEPGNVILLKKRCANRQTEVPAFPGCQPIRFIANRAVDSGGITR